MSCLEFGTRVKTERGALKWTKRERLWFVHFQDRYSSPLEHLAESGSNKWKISVLFWNSAVRIILCSNHADVFYENVCRVAKWRHMPVSVTRRFDSILNRVWRDVLLFTKPAPVKQVMRAGPPPPSFIDPIYLPSPFPMLSWLRSTNPESPECGLKYEPEPLICLYVWPRFIAHFTVHNLIKRAIFKENRKIYAPSVWLHFNWL